MSETRPDLASIVLADEAPRASVHKLDHLIERLDDDDRGFDARSILILLLVMVAFSLILAVSINMLQANRMPPIIEGSTKPQAAAPEQSSSGLASSGAGQGRGDSQLALAGGVSGEQGQSSKDAAPSQTSPLTPGIDLGVQRVSVRSTGAGAVVTVDVSNQGRMGLRTDAAPNALLLINETLHSTMPIGNIASGEREKIEFSGLGCGLGAPTITVILDSTSLVKERNKQNNSRSIQKKWPC